MSTQDEQNKLQQDLLNKAKNVHDEQNRHLHDKWADDIAQREDPNAYRTTIPYTDYRHVAQKHSPNRLKKKLFRHPGQETVELEHKGYGVITSMPIKKGEIVEECVVAYETIEPGWEYLDGVMHARNQNVLANYRFAGPQNSGDQIKGKHADCWVVAFGNASIYNHADKPNMMWYHEAAQRLIVFVAVRDIEAGEELCHSYTQLGLRPTEVQDIIKKRHYHPQFMREVNMHGVTKEAPKEIKREFGDEEVKNMKTTDIPLNSTEHYKADIEGVVDASGFVQQPSTTFQQYVKTELVRPNNDNASKAYKPKKNMSTPDDIEPVSDDWQPPGSNEKIKASNFLDKAKDYEGDVTINKDED